MSNKKPQNQNTESSIQSVLENKQDNQISKTEDNKNNSVQSNKKLILTHPLRT